jgi:deazaflavin-dependent oxidoreductase (nitroreductase family)
MRLSQVLQRVVRYFNPVARFVLGTPLHALMSGRLMLLSFTGRTTGRSYTTPVSYVRDGNSLLVPGGGTWWKNLENGPHARVCLRGVWKGVTPVVISEPIPVAELMQRMLADNPAIAVFTAVKPGPDGRPDAAALERELRRGFVVVRLRLDDEDGRARTAAAW